jgi:transposase-like protein
MIKEEITHQCRKCQSPNLSRNGKTAAGKQKFLCTDCGAGGTLVLSLPPYSEEKKEEILGVLHERASIRGLHRVFGVNRKTVLKWVKKKSKPS